MSKQSFRIRFELFASNGVVVKSGFLAGRPPKAVRELAISLVKLGVHPRAMFVALSAALGRIAVDDDLWEESRKARLGRR